MVVKMLAESTSSKINGFICKKCGCFEYYYIATRKSYECKGCCYQASVTANTIMHKTHTTLEKWFWAIYLVARDKRGLSALALSKQIDVSYPVSYTHLRAHETGRNLVCRLLLEKKKKK